MIGYKCINVVIILLSNKLIHYINATLSFEIKLQCESLFL